MQNGPDAAGSFEAMTPFSAALRRVGAGILGLGFLALGLIALAGAGMFAFAWQLVDAVDRDGNAVIVTPWKAILYTVIFLVIAVDSLRFSLRQIRRALGRGVSSRLS